MKFKMVNGTTEFFIDFAIRLRTTFSKEDQKNSPNTIVGKAEFFYRPSLHEDQTRDKCGIFCKKTAPNKMTANQNSSKMNAKIMVKDNLYYGKNFEILRLTTLH